MVSCSGDGELLLHAVGEVGVTGALGHPLIGDHGAGGDEADGHVFAGLERDRLRSRYVRALVRAGELLLAVGRVDESQRLASAAQEADPWSTDALRLQAEGYLALDDRAAALRAHRRAVDLAVELGIAPSPDLDRLARAIT